MESPMKIHKLIEQAKQIIAIGQQIETLEFIRDRCDPGYGALRKLKDALTAAEGYKHSSIDMDKLLSDSLRNGAAAGIVWAKQEMENIATNMAQTDELASDPEIVLPPPNAVT